MVETKENDITQNYASNKFMSLSNDNKRHSPRITKLAKYYHIENKKL